jgi:hypothetical protein
LIPVDLKLETDLEEESAEVDTAALNTGEPRQCEEFIQQKTDKDLLMREDLIRKEVVNINCSKFTN